VKKNIATISIGIIIVLLVIAAVIVIGSEDRKAPIITLNIPTGREITYTSGEDKEKLIQYATAVDDKDGDVTDSIKIEDIYPTSDLLTVKVVYVARDKSNNIARVNQVFRYIASQEEIDIQAKINQEPTSGTNAATVAATIASSTKSQQTTSATTATITATAKPVISLTQSEATITQGDNFNVIQYVKDITDDKDARSTLFTRIIAGGYEANKVGDISISIYCTDSEGNQSNVEKLVLHVKAKKVEVSAEPEATTQAPTEAPIAPTEAPIAPTETSTQASTQAQTQVSTPTPDTILTTQPPV